MSFMSDKDFNEVVEEQIVLISNSLASKADEYAGTFEDRDRLHNFNTAARVEGTTVEKAIWGMMMKHFVSVQDMVHGRTVARSSLVHEKIGDLINYMVILKAHFLNEIKIQEELEKKYLEE